MRTLNESATRLPDPVVIGSDYSRHPIPGQLALWFVHFHAPSRVPTFYPSTYSAPPEGNH